MCNSEMEAKRAGGLMIRGWIPPVDGGGGTMDAPSIPLPLIQG